MSNLCLTFFDGQTQKFFVENCCRGSPLLALAVEKNRSRARQLQKQCQYGKYDFKNNTHSADFVTLCVSVWCALYVHVCVWEETAAVTTKGCKRI